MRISDWSSDVCSSDLGTIPGPQIRVRQGDRLRVLVENRLDEETTVHWHGIRLPNAMDGVPHLTQKPIGPGETFAYAFDLPDAGPICYPTPQRRFGQAGPGTSGGSTLTDTRNRGR